MLQHLQLEMNLTIKITDMAEFRHALGVGRRREAAAQRSADRYRGTLLTKACGDLLYPFYNTLYLAGRDDARREVARLNGLHGAEHTELHQLRAERSKILDAIFFGVGLGITIPIVVCLGSLLWSLRR